MIFYQCPDNANIVSKCLQFDPNSVATTIKVDWSLSSISQDAVMLFFGGALLLWAVGLGIGMLVSVIRRTRI